MSARHLDHALTSIRPRGAAAQAASVGAATNCGAVALLTLAIAFAYVADESEAVVPYLLLMLPVAVWTVLGLRARASEAYPAWLRPPVLVGLWVILAWWLPGLVGFFSRTPLEALIQTVGIDLRSSTQAMALVACGTGAVWAGYLLAMRSHPRQGLVSLDRREPVFHRVLALYLLTIALRLWRIHTAGSSYDPDADQLGSLGPFNEWLSYLENVRYLCLALAVICFVSGRWGPGFLSVIWTVEVGFAFTSGWMKPLLWILLVTVGAASAAGWSLRGALKSPVVSGGLVLLALLGVVIIPTVESLRPMIRNRDIDVHSTSGLISGVDRAMRQSWGQGMDVALASFDDKITGRQAQVIHGVGVLMRDTPAVVPYRGLDQLLAVPLYILPRVLWIDKPLISRGVLFSKEYLGYPKDTISSSAITVFGEPYMDAGWPGLLIALPALGFLYGCLYKLLMARASGRAGLISVAVYLALLCFVIDVEADFTSYFCRLVQLAIIIPAIAWTVSTSRRPGPTRLHAGSQPSGDLARKQRRRVDATLSR